MKKFLTISSLIGVTLLSSISVYAQEPESNIEIEPRFKNCTSWVTTNIREYCDTSDRCFIINNGTNIVERKQKRECSDDGKIFEETRTDKDKQGCC